MPQRRPEGWRVRLGKHHRGWIYLPSELFHACYGEYGGDGAVGEYANDCGTVVAVFAVVVVSVVAAIDDGAS